MQGITRRLIRVLLLDFSGGKQTALSHDEVLGVNEEWYPMRTERILEIP
jgi:hypothetical protein